MVFELIPVEMRLPSMITVLLFAVGTSIAVPIIWYFQKRLNTIEGIVSARCIDIEKLAEIAGNLEKTIEAFKDENQRTINWIREDNSSRMERIEKNLAEIRQKLYRGT